VTRAGLDAIKSKPHGPDVDALIEEIEDCWSRLDAAQKAIRSASRDLDIMLEGMPRWKPIPC
jgi:hypothetical protein